jgi:hypothetical protein
MNISVHSLHETYIPNSYLHSLDCRQASLKYQPRYQTRQSPYQFYLLQTKYPHQ